MKTVDLPTRGFICESCGDVGFPKTVLKGSFLAELLLWFLFLLPGLLYTMWRRQSRNQVCPKCHGHMVPIQTPGGRHLAQKFNPHVLIRG